MHFPKLILSAGEYDRNPEPMRETGLVIDAAARALVPMGEIRHDKAGSSYLGENFIVNLVDVLLPVNPHRLVSSIPNRRSNAAFIYLAYTWFMLSSNHIATKALADGVWVSSNSLSRTYPSTVKWTCGCERKVSGLEISIHPCRSR